MAKNIGITKYDKSRLKHILRILHLERYRHLVIDAPLEECLTRLKQLEGAQINSNRYSILVETNDSLHRFILFRKSQNRDYGYIIGYISSPPNVAQTEMRLEIYPSNTLISIAPLMIFCSAALILPSLMILPLALAPAWCYVVWWLFTLSPPLIWIPSMIATRNQTLDEFETLYLKMLPVNYKYLP